MNRKGKLALGASLWVLGTAIAAIFAAVVPNAAMTAQHHDSNVAWLFFAFAGLFAYKAGGENASKPEGVIVPGAWPLAMGAALFLSFVAAHFLVAVFNPLTIALSVGITLLILIGGSLVGGNFMPKESR